MKKESVTLGILSRYRTAIMGFAALWIFLNHEWQPVLDSAHSLAFTERFIRQLGFCGVDFFFFLSGLGLVFSVEKHSIPAFYGRRLSRVLLPFALAALGMLYTGGWTFLQWAQKVSGYLFWTQSIYSLLWFVPAICILYLLFPLYYQLFRRSSGKVLFTGAVLILWLLLTLWREDHIHYDMFGFTNRIPVFAVGILAGWLIRFLEFFGKISLEFYCVQEWIGDLVHKRIWDRYSNLLVNAVDFLCVLAAALVLYGLCWLIRWPFTLLKKRQTART